MLNIAKNVLIMLNNLQQMYLKLLQEEKLKKKTAEATGFLIGNKIANRTIQVQKTSQENKLETITNENDKEIPKTGYIPIE